MNKKLHITILAYFKKSSIEKMNIAKMRFFNDNLRKYSDEQIMKALDELEFQKYADNTYYMKPTTN